MTDPLVSVVLPMFNRSKSVRMSAGSIIDQEYKNIEIILVNDGSEDDSGKICSELKAKDSRIRLINLPINSGVGFARSIGNKVATGKYIATMDSDDFSYPDRLYKQVKYMEEHPEISISGGNAIKISNGKKREMKMEKMDARLKSLLLYVDRAFVHPTTIFRKSFLEENALNYCSGRTTDDDYDLYSRCLVHGAKFGNIDDVLIDYIRHPKNITNTSANLERDKLSIREYLIREYFRNLTVAECRDIAELLQKKIRMSPVRIVRALNAVDKALIYQRSVFGEDRSLLLSIIHQKANFIKATLRKEFPKFGF